MEHSGSSSEVEIRHVALLAALRSSAQVRRTLPSARPSATASQDPMDEVLLSQINVLDPVRSTRDKPAFHSFPGELRLLGGQRVGGERDHSDTLSQQLFQLGFPAVADRLRATLFAKVEFRQPDRGIIFVVWQYVAFQDDNRKLLQPDLGHVNRELQR